MNPNRFVVDFSMDVFGRFWGLAFLAKRQKLLGVNSL